MPLDQEYSIWVPDLKDDELGPAWTDWAKPVLFATAQPVITPIYLPAVELTFFNTGELSGAPNYAVVVDLPGSRAIQIGMAFAERGFRPVPLFNGCPGENELISTRELVASLRGSAERLRELSIETDANPVFLLDARRMSKEVAPAPGKFDNRWFTFPQDFPSANLLLARGIQSILLVQGEKGQPSDDLSHVLRRWQDAGMTIFAATPDSSQVEQLDVHRPRRFRSLWYALLALMGLYPNSTGGFGGIIPHPSSG